MMMMMMMMMMMSNVTSCDVYSFFSFASWIPTLATTTQEEVTCAHQCVCWH